MSDGGYEDKHVPAKAGPTAGGAPKPKDPLRTRIVKINDHTAYRIVTMPLGSDHGVQLHAKAKMLGDGIKDPDLHIADVSPGTCRAETRELVDSLQHEKPRYVEIEP